MHHPWYDRDGQPIDLMDWAFKHEDPAYHTVGLHFVRGWMISTIWIGIDSNPNPFSQVRLIFETMIFPPGDARIGGDDDLDDYQERHATEAAAADGHNRAVAAVLERLGPGAAADISAGPIPAAGEVDWDQLAAGLESGAKPETSDPQQDRP